MLLYLLQSWKQKKRLWFHGLVIVIVVAITLWKVGGALRERIRKSMWCCDRFKAKVMFEILVCPRQYVWTIFPNMSHIITIITGNIFRIFTRILPACEYLMRGCVSPATHCHHQHRQQFCQASGQSGLFLLGVNTINLNGYNDTERLLEVKNVENAKQWCYFQGNIPKF